MVLGDDISGNTGAQFPHTFKMSGGTIYKNGSDGVVLAHQKTFTQTGGNINDNGQDGIRTEAGNTTLNLSGGWNYGNKRNAIWNYGTATINNTYGMGYTSWSNTDNFVSANNVNGNIYNKGTFTVNTNTGYVVLLIMVADIIYTMTQVELSTCGGAIPALTIWLWEEQLVLQL